MIQAGFYECEITPPYRTDRPCAFHKTKVLKISDPLKVRAMALSDGVTKVAVIGLDNVGCGPGFVRKLKTALPGISVLLSGSHTHYGGVLYDPLPDIDRADPLIRRIAVDEMVSYDPVYYEFCLRQAITAVTFAFENLQDVDFSFGSGRVENLIFNRRIRMKDGSVKTHPGKGNPDSVGYAGPVDEELGVMGVWKKGTDELLGFALNVSCHACINLEGATSDFPGVAIDTVRAVYGSRSGAVFLTGASGDLTQVDNMSQKLDTGKPIAIKLGRVVGGEAIKILASADRGPVETLKFLRECYTLRQRPAEADADEIAEAYEKVKVFEDSADYTIASMLVQNDYVRKHAPPLETELAALQIGPLVIGATPCEFFTQFGLNFKAQSKFPFTWFSQLSFLCSYIPTPDAFDPRTGGGYEASTAKFVPETGVEMTAVISRLSQQLTPEAVPPPKTVPPRTTAWGYNFKRKNLN